jgi:hypothetical protein
VNALLLITGIRNVLFGFAFLFAGFMSLAPLSEAEEEARCR